MHAAWTAQSRPHGPRGHIMTNEFNNRLRGGKIYENVENVQQSQKCGLDATLCSIVRKNHGKTQKALKSLNDLTGTRSRATTCPHTEMY